MYLLAAILCLISIPTENIFFGAIYCPTVEINSYGHEADVRDAVIFRDSAGQIIDWRWYKPNMGPYDDILIWEEKGKTRAVQFRRIHRTRTLHDVELMERQKFPRHERRPLFPHRRP